MRLITLIILAIVIANIIAWLALPDAIANMALVAITLIGLGIAFFVWRRR